MKYCSKCGELNPDEAKFCSKCGYKFNVTSPSTMPAEVDCTDEFLARSDWRLPFHYKINGEYQRYSERYPTPNQVHEPHS